MGVGATNRSWQSLQASGLRFVLAVRASASKATGLTHVAVGQNRFGIPFWLVGAFSLVLGMGCSPGARDFDPWPLGLSSNLPIYQYAF